MSIDLTQVPFEPYYSKDGITIYNADCREVLPHLPKFDLLLTDPPYGLSDKWQGGGGSAKTSWRFKSSEARTWDSATCDGIYQAVELCEDAIVWGGNYYALPPKRCWFIWDKKTPDTFSTGQAELAWTTLDKPIRAFRMAQCEAHAEMGHKWHPTQKPLGLIQWCLSFTPQSKTVLDPFMGSGTTLLACKKNGCSAVGIELNESYCKNAVERLKECFFDFGE